MAYTNSGTLTQEEMDLIAQEMLIVVDDVYAFMLNGPIQAPLPGEIGRGVKNLQFNRVVLPTGTYTEASRRLGDTVDIADTAQEITLTTTTLRVREYGGPHNGTEVVPFGVTEWVTRRATHDIVAIIGEFMRRDYDRFHDVAMRDFLLSSTNVVTPNGAAEGAITVGQVMTVAFLRKLNKYMKDLKIPTYPNGRWRLCIDTTDELNLKSDTAYTTAMTQLAQANPLFTGHVMSIEGFDIMVSTMLPTKAVGAAGAVTGHQGCAWGPYGIGHGVDMPPSIRDGDNTNYKRKNRVVWISYEAMGLLYADLLVRIVTT